ncbi:MAG TPA: PQQ-binding-like beta-propeller repeat protein, partial [Lacipirellulaceae bacterium]|nr:PQQ-binding-like beta-propeller repeat protein [Lacipirellulaceae bacterium]
MWRLDAATGKLVWRQALDDRVIGLTLAGPRLLAASEGGKLYVIDAEEGRLAGVVAFTQPLRTAAAASERGDRIYVVGEHSVIYTLAAEDLSCAGVWYTGHAPGEITAPPVALLNKVLIAENAGNDSSRVRILKTDAQGVVAGEATSDRLLGRIVTPLAVSGRRVAVATTLGQLAAYEVSGAEGRGSLTPLARREGSARQPLAPHLLLHDGHLWIAAQSLAKLAILPTENQFSLVSLERDFPRDVFDATPQAIDDLVIHVRRSQGATGAVVAATNAKTNRALWETAVAVPLAGAPAAAGPLDLSLIAANGAAYRLDRQAMVRGVQDRAERPTGIPIKTPLTHAVELGEGRLAAGADGAATLVLSGPGGVRS